MHTNLSSQAAAGLYVASAGGCEIEQFTLGQSVLDHREEVLLLETDVGLEQFSYRAQVRSVEFTCRELATERADHRVEAEVIRDSSCDQRPGFLMVYQRGKKQFFFLMEMVAGASQIEVDEVVSAVTQDVRVVLGTRFLEPARLRESVMVVMS